MKIAIVHDYLNQMGGAERVVEVFHRMFPEAPIYTTIINQDKLLEGLKDADIKITWMQKMPLIQKWYKKYFMIYPFAIKNMDLSEYDLIISSSSAYAKGVKKKKNAIHICYCYTPMRFVWDYDNYVKRENFNCVIGKVLPFFIRMLKKWDLKVNKEVDYFIAISTEIKNRIESCYNRKAEIIFPPVQVNKFKINKTSEDYYLIVSRLVPYKRIDVAIKAFNKLGIKLIIIGDGPARKNLEDIADDNIIFKGRVSDSDVVDYMSRCKAFVFPGKEDFGLTPLEANASGKPVVAFKGGGTLDTVIDGVTGVYFDGEEVDNLVRAVKRCEELKFDSNLLRSHAEKFNEDVFINRFNDFVKDKINKLNLIENGRTL